MAGFKQFEPGLRFNRGNRVTADEQDDYNIYTISNPGIGNSWFASAGTAGTSSAIAYTMINRQPDYPRNLNYILAGSASGMTGTFVTNGYDQFGNPVTETVTITPAASGGTSVGSQIFARVDSGTLSYGTAVGAGTPKIGFVPGTGCLFGLPVKVAGTQDISLLSMLNGTGVITYNGGTISGFFGTIGNPGNGYIRPAATMTGSETINVWIRSSYIPDTQGVLSNLNVAG